MNTKQLRQFLEVYKCASINKAAQKLYLSRSSLISSINALEEELGQPLLQRSHSGIIPTEFGTVVIEASQQIMDIYDSLMEKSTEISHNLLSISSSHLPFVPAVFAQHFANNEETNHFRYMEKRRCWVCQDVIEDHSEIGIISTPTSNRDIVQRFFKQNALHHRIICSSPTCCLVGEQNPLCQNDLQQVSQEELASLYRIMYQDTTVANNDNLLQVPQIYLPCKGNLYISDRSSMQNLLTDTNSYFACVFYPSKYRPSNTCLLQIQDLPSTQDIIWFKKSKRRLKPITQEFLEKIYLALDVEPDAVPF